MRIIATENVHQTIHPNKPTDIEVIEDNPVFLKIPTRGALSPAKFKIEFRGADAKRKNIDLKIYLSFTEKEPGEGKYDKFVNNVNFIIS